MNSQWGKWIGWSSCSSSGVRSRQLACDSPAPSNGGLNFSGSATHQKSCSPNTCSGKITLHTHTHGCSYTYIAS